MKNILFSLTLLTPLVHGAASGPLQVGDFTEYVSTTATNKIVHSLQVAKEENGGIMPTGSITQMWSDVSNEGVQPYFITHPEQLQASATYVAYANASPLVQATYNNFQKATTPFGQEVSWGTFYLTTNALYGEQEKIAIPDLNLNRPTVVGIMLLNQKLTFTPDQKTSFGGAIAAEISIMQLLYNTNPALFNKLYNDCLPASSSGTTE